MGVALTTCCGREAPPPKAVEGNRRKGSLLPGGQDNTHAVPTPLPAVFFPHPILNNSKALAVVLSASLPVPMPNWVATITAISGMKVGLLRWPRALCGGR